MLAESTEYQVSLDGQKFRVAFSAVEVEPAMAEAESAETSTGMPVATAVAPVDSSVDASVLLKVDFSPSQAVIKANGKIDNFKYS